MSTTETDAPPPPAKPVKPVKRLPFNRARASQLMHEAAEKLPGGIRPYVNAVIPIIALTMDIFFKLLPLLRFTWRVVSDMLRD